MLKLRLAVITALAIALITPPQAASAEPLPTPATCDTGKSCAGRTTAIRKPKKWKASRPPSRPSSGSGQPVSGRPPMVICPSLKPGLCQPGEKNFISEIPDSTPGGVRQVVAKLKLSDPTPQIGPDPANNEWNMLAVGFPIWLWTKGPTRLSTTAKHDGLSYNLTATRTRTVFDTGDGHTKSCAATTPYYWTGNPDDPSPTCGYVYQRRSPIGKPYTITATTHWRVDWKSGNQRGSLTTIQTGTTKLTVGELHSIIRG